MKKIKIIFFIPFIISILLVLIASIVCHELVFNGIIFIILISFLLSGMLLSKDCLLGIIIGFIPAIITTFLGLRDRGQWINEMIFAIPIYLFYIACYITLCVVNIIKHRKVVPKTIEEKKSKMVADIIISIVIIAVIIAVIWWAFGYTNSSNIAHYNNFAEEFKYIPETTEIGNYKNIEVNHYQKRMLFSKFDVYTLTAQYVDDMYLKENKSINERYIFEQDIIRDDTANVQPLFQVEDFSFRMLSFEHYNLCYPKEIVFIGTSDKTKEITFICFNDKSLDFIDMPLSKFLIEICGWKG